MEAPRILLPILLTRVWRAKYTGTTTINLNGGTLNMSGFAIGTAAVPITNVNFVTSGTQSATLSNLGGTGINGAGLTMNGSVVGQSNQPGFFRPRVVVQLRQQIDHFLN